MDKTKTALIVQAAKNRVQYAQILEKTFDKQLAVIKDPSLRKCVYTSRRAGKSTMSAFALISKAIENPDMKILYTGLTAHTVSTVMFNGILKPWLKKLNIKATYRSIPVPQLTFTNGSVIYGLGIDTSEKESEKIRGNAFDLVVLDECQSLTIDMFSLIKEKIEPTLSDRRGSLMLLGTPGNVKNYFYHVCMGTVPGWSLHHWTTVDNPHMKEQYLADLARMKLDDPEIETDIVYRREWLGEWAIDNTLLCYSVNSQKTIIQECSEKPDTLRYVLGVDFGYRDANAFVVMGHTKNSIYILESHKQAELLTDEIVEIIRSYQLHYKDLVIYGDNAAAQTLADLQHKYGIPIKPTQTKADKVRFIELMSSDLYSGRIKIVQPSNLSLLKEYSELIWDQRHLQRTGQKREHQKIDNHLCDAALYAWRSIKTYRGEITATKEPEHMHWTERHKLRLTQQSENSTDSWDGFFND